MTLKRNIYLILYVLLTESVILHFASILHFALVRLTQHVILHSALTQIVILHFASILHFAVLLAPLVKKGENLAKILTKHSGILRHVPSLASALRVVTRPSRDHGLVLSDGSEKGENNTH